MDATRLDELKKLEERLGYEFRQAALLDTALTHTSYVKGDGMADRHNERLEFLGDAVLELVTSEHIFKTYPTLDEGSMTRIRAQAVCEEPLCEVAKRLGIGEMLLLGHGEANSGGREKPSILSDALEAVIGAMYIDGGMDAAKPFIMSFAQSSIERLSDGRANKDSKTMLQEYVQKLHLGRIEYELVGSSGPDHSKVFTMGVRLCGDELGTGDGHTKQEAGQHAAAAALEYLKNTKEGTDQDK